MNHFLVGEWGEEIAVRFLQERGLRIIERRARFGRLEIDIVAREGRIWVFVEVKMRRTAKAGRSVEAMGERKIKAFRRAVERYLQEYGLQREEIRCDFVGIDVNEEDEPIITYFPGGITW